MHVREVPSHWLQTTHESLIFVFSDIVYSSGKKLRLSGVTIDKGSNPVKIFVLFGVVYL